MENKPLLSICIPTYNRKDILKQCIESFIEEAYLLKIPVIISDNNSSDGTDIFLKKISKKYNNLTYFIQKTNVGIDLNMLKVAQLCKTKYGWWLGDDDGINQGALKKILKVINNKDYNLILLNTQLQDGSKLFNFKNDIEISNLNIFSKKYIYKMYFGSIIFNKNMLINLDYKKYIGTRHLYAGIILDYLYNKSIKNRIYILINKKTYFERDKFTAKKTYSNCCVKLNLYDLPLWENLIPRYFKNILKKNTINYSSKITLKYLLGLKAQNNYNIKLSYISFKNYKVHTKYETIYFKINYFITCFVPYLFLRGLYKLINKYKK